MAENHDKIEVQKTSEGESADAWGKWNPSWWKSNKGTVVSEFLAESSLHGLKYIGQSKRHIVERTFWIVTFIVGVAAAGFLIYEVFDRYEETPVTVSFQGKEQSVDTIPFPAVTFCYNYQFTKEKVESLRRSLAGLMKGEPEYNAIREKLKIIHSICQPRNTFFRTYFGNVVLHYSGRDDSYYIKNQSKLQQEIIDFLLESTPSCEEMIPFVMLDGGNVFKERAKIFNPVITEYGKCCTFNMLPTPLMLKEPSVGNQNNGDWLSNPVLGTKSKIWWNQKVIDDWQKWSYEKDFLLNPDSYKSKLGWNDVGGIDTKISHPFRNQRLGYSFGLSVVLNTFEPYFDDVTFHGTTFMLHNPVDTPRVSQFPTVIGTKKEVFIKIHPDITLADPDIKDLKPEKRQCFFGKEKVLKYFRPYTQENCFEDCIASLIETECSCSMFYIPRPNDTVLCRLHRRTPDGDCISDTLTLLSKKVVCGHCLPLCEYIDYKFEMSTAKILNSDISTLQKLPDSDILSDELNQGRDDIYQNISIVHIFYESPSTVPKLRKRLYGTTDLIANTGGILGLCLGFSVLSGAEVLYYVLMRTIWQKLSRPCLWCNSKEALMELKNPGKSNHSGSNKKSKFKRIKESGELFRFKWLCCILVGSVASGFLIYMLLVRDEETVQAKETFEARLKIHEINDQYWAVATFCFGNQFSMEKVLELRRVAEFTTDENHRYSAETNLSIIDAMCKYKDALETSSSNEFPPIQPDVANYTFLMKFLEENTISCNEIFPACVYMGRVQANCNEFIKPINTIHGRCCRVMVVPAQPKSANSSVDKISNITKELNERLDLSLAENQNYRIPKLSLFSRTKFKSSYFVVYGANLSEEFSKDIQPPYFSVLSNLNQDPYQCDNVTTSTNQILFSLQSPGKFSQIQDFSPLLVANEEVVLTLFPKAVSSDPSTDLLNNENRTCYPYYLKDMRLGDDYFNTTKAAFFEKCSRDFETKFCKCALFGYEYYEDDTWTCKTGSNSTDTICMRKMNEIASKLKQICTCTGPNCFRYCSSSTTYSYTTTNQPMRNASKVWASLNKFGNDTTIDIPWGNNKTGIIHFAFNTLGQTKPTSNAGRGGYLVIILTTAVSILICLSIIVFPHLWRRICGKIVKCTVYIRGLLHTRKISALNTNEEP